LRLGQGVRLEPGAWQAHKMVADLLDERGRLVEAKKHGLKAEAFAGYLSLD
jgi:hypothetical protein